MPQALAPGIRVIRKETTYSMSDMRSRETVINIEDGEKTEESKPADAGPIVHIHYVLAVNAVGDRIAERKAQAFATVRHPADALDIITNIEGIMETSTMPGMFNEFGPTKPFEVIVDVET